MLGGLLLWIDRASIFCNPMLKIYLATYNVDLGNRQNVRQHLYYYTYYSVLLIAHIIL
jgi:hypothetical protein